MRRAWCVIATVWCAASFSASAQNWPSWRGAEAAGIGAGSPPLTWDLAKKENVAWKQAIPGLGLGSPIVWGDRVYITTAVPMAGDAPLQIVNDNVTLAKGEQEHAWRLYALDRKTGRILWERTVHQATPRGARHVKASHANATPVTDGKIVVARMGVEGIFAFDRNGKQLWKHILDAPGEQDRYDQANSLVIYRNLVILQDDHYRGGSSLTAFDLKNGRIVWREARAEGHACSTPTIFPARRKGERDLLVTQTGRFIRGIDPATGKGIWLIRQDEAHTRFDRIPAPIAAGDFILISGGSPTSPVFAIRRTATGDITLPVGATQNEHIAWTVTTSGAYMPSPIVVGDLFYVLRVNGAFGAYRVATGEMVYQQRLGEGGYFTASPVAARGHIYVINDDGEVFIVRAGEKLDVAQRHSLGEMCFVTPALSGDLLLLRTRHNVYGIATAGIAR